MVLQQRKKNKSKKLTKSIKGRTDTDNADDLVLLPNTPSEAESLLRSYEQASRGTGFYENSEFIRLI